MNIIQTLEAEQAAKLSAAREIPDFAPGDTVIVNVKVTEGERSRVQAYEGVCIARSGGGRRGHRDERRETGRREARRDPSKPCHGHFPRIARRGPPLGAAPNAAGK